MPSGGENFKVVSLLICRQPFDPHKEWSRQGCCNLTRRPNVVYGPKGNEWDQGLAKGFVKNLYTKSWRSDAQSISIRWLSIMGPLGWTEGLIAPGNYAFYSPYFIVLHAELATQFHQFLNLHQILTKDWKDEVPSCGSDPQSPLCIYCMHHIVSTLPCIGEA